MDDDTVYITTIANKSAVVKVREAYGGGMVEFIDAISGVPRGCAGIHWWRESKHSMEYRGSLPKLPDPEKWIL